MMACGAANASFISIGPVTLAGASVPTVGLPDSGAFSDTFSFSLQQGNRIQIGISTFFWGNTPQDIPDFSYVLNTGFGSASVAPSVSVTDDSLDSGGIFSGLETGRTYTLTINGTDSSNLGSSYSMLLAAMNAPEPNTVPEPTSIALVFSGLGLMGLASRRLKTKKEA